MAWYTAHLITYFKLKNAPFIGIIVFCFLSMPSIARACSCATSDPPAEFNRAKAVFIGRMLGGTEKLSFTDNEGKVRQIEAGAVRFSVEELFKGNISKEVTVTIASMKGTSCGDYGLLRGELYVVYAYESERDKKILYSGVCTRTSVADSKYTKEDLDFLRNLPAAGTGGNLRGRIWVDVKEIDGGSAKPLPNVKVRIRGDDEKVIVVTTNEKGEFEVKKIKAGTYRVEPQLPNQYYFDEDSEAVEIADRGTAEVGFEAYFTGKAEGRIVDKNGAAFNSIFLQFLSVDAQRKPRQVTGHSEGENGGFSVEGVPPGEYVLFLELQHEDYNRNRKYYYPGTFKRREAKVFKVGLGGKVKGLKFILPGEFQVRTVEGQVFWTDGKPAADVEIILLCPQSSRPNGFRVEFSPTSVRTDGEGKFKLEGFTGEEYWLEARGSKEGYKVDSLDGNKFYSPPKKIVLTENLKDIKVALSENGFSGGCEN